MRSSCTGAHGTFGICISAMGRYCNASDKPTYILTTIPQKHRFTMMITLEYGICNLLAASDLLFLYFPSSFSFLRHSRFISITIRLRCHVHCTIYDRMCLFEYIHNVERARERERLSKIEKTYCVAHNDEHFVRWQVVKLLSSWPIMIKIRLSIQTTKALSSLKMLLFSMSSMQFPSISSYFSSLFLVQISKI